MRVVAKKQKRARRNTTPGANCFYESQAVKIWWHGEPMTVGGLRWRIVENDLRQRMKAALERYQREWTFAGMKRVRRNKV